MQIGCLSRQILCNFCFWMALPASFSFFSVNSCLIQKLKENRHGKRLDYPCNLFSDGTSIYDYQRWFAGNSRRGVAAMTKKIRRVKQDRLIILPCLKLGKYGIFRREETICLRWPIVKVNDSDFVWDFLYPKRKGQRNFRAKCQMPTRYGQSGILRLALAAVCAEVEIVDSASHLSSLLPPFCFAHCSNNSLYARYKETLNLRNI